MIIVQRSGDFEKQEQSGVAQVCAYPTSFQSTSHPEVDAFVSLCRFNVDSGFSYEASYPHHTEVFNFVLRGAAYTQSSMDSSPQRFTPGQAFVVSPGKNPVITQKIEGADEPTEMLQIQLKSQRDDLEPFFEAGTYNLEAEFNQLVPLASATGDDGALFIRQNCFVYGAVLAEKRSTMDVLPPGRLGLIYIISGHLKVGRTALQSGDAGLIVDQEEINFRAQEETSFVYLDLPPTAKRAS